MPKLHFSLGLRFLICPLGCGTQALQPPAPQDLIVQFSESRSLSFAPHGERWHRATNGLPVPHTPGLSSRVSTDLPTLARVSNPLKPQPPPQPHGTVRVTDRNDMQKAPGPAAPAPTTPDRAENTRASGHPRSFPLLPAPCVRVPSHPGWPPLDGRVFWRDQITGGREKGMPDQCIHRSHRSDSETQSAFKFPDLLVPYPTSQL